jgi:hypothetical protein
MNLYNPNPLQPYIKYKPNLNLNFNFVHLSTFIVKVMNYHGYYIMLFGYVP